MDQGCVDASCAAQESLGSSGWLLMLGSSTGAVASPRSDSERRSQWTTSARASSTAGRLTRWLRRISPSAAPGATSSAGRVTCVFSGWLGLGLIRRDRFAKRGTPVRGPKAATGSAPHSRPGADQGVTDAGSPSASRARTSDPLPTVARPRLSDRRGGCPATPSWFGAADAVSPNSSGTPGRGRKR